MKRLWKRFGHVWLLAYAFIYVPWFMYLERTVTTGYHVMHIALDDLIPFNEYFIIPYLMWFAYVAMAILYFFFMDKQDYYRLCIFLFTGMTISLVICTLFPNGTDLRSTVDPSSNVCAMLVSRLRQADTNTNVFPSIHAFNSIGVYLAIRNSDRLKHARTVKVLAFLLTFMICLSTMFLKQHSALDVMGAGVMAYLLYPFVYGGAYATEKKRVLQNI